MSFLFPALLAALAAVSVPIAIHLLNKFRVKNVDWAAMRFLRDSVRKNQRRVRMEDLILLILRCLLVILVALAFAQPVARAFAKAGAGELSGPVATIVLLDNSASMTQSDGVSTRFEEAKKQIAAWWERRDSHSLAALWLVSRGTEQAIAQPSADAALFRKILEMAQPGQQGTDLTQGIRQAYQTLSNVGGRAREIRVYTDSQSTAWLGLEEIRKLAAEHPEIVLNPVVIGESGEPNLGITGLQTDGSVPAAGQPTRLLVEVGNYGAEPAQDVRLTLSLSGGGTVNEAFIPSIPPGTTQSVPLLVTFPAPGQYAVTASIPPDALALDNERTLALDVVRQMRVLIAEGGGAEEDMERDGFFLAHALLPLSRDRAAQYYLEAQFTRPEALDRAALEQADTVFLCNPGAVDGALAASLKDFLAQGGSVVIFPGPLSDGMQWESNAAWAELLPARLAPVTQIPEGGQPLSWQSTDYEHPITALWNDPAHGTLGSVRAYRYFPLRLRENGEIGTIARFANGDPAAVEWAVGEGRVILFGTAATPGWTNLPLHPAFVPLVQRVMGFLHRRNENALLLSPGQSFVKEVPAEWRGKSFSVQGPGEDDPRSAGQIVSDSGKPLLRYSGTDRLGAYHVTVGDETAAMFAVQLDAAESDLRQLDQARLTELAEAVKSGAGAGTGSEPAETSRMVVTREYWTVLIWIALGIAALEAILAHRFSFAREVKA